MKFTSIILTTVLLGLNSYARTIKCNGQADYGRIEITSLVISDDSIVLKGKDLRAMTSFQKSYVIIEENDNFYTDLNKPALFIGANTSGDPEDYSDDMSLSRLGMHRSGFGSDIAFELDGKRVFGEVKCSKK